MIFSLKVIQYTIKYWPRLPLEFFQSNESMKKLNIKHCIQASDFYKIWIYGRKAALFFRFNNVFSIS